MENHYLNEKLTLKEKGMVATFQAHAEHLSTNRISHTHIYFACSEGNTTIRKTLESLVKKRIITKERIFNNGQLLATNYLLSVDEPVENWTPYPNTMLDNMVKLTSIETIILSRLVWKHPLACSAASFAIKLHCPADIIINALSKLEQDGWVISIDSLDIFNQRYKLNMDVWNV